MNAVQRIERHNILDGVLAEFLVDNPGVFLSGISAARLLDWHYEKVMQEQEKELKSQQHKVAEAVKAYESQHDLPIPEPENPIKIIRSKVSAEFRGRPLQFKEVEGGKVSGYYHEVSEIPQQPLPSEDNVDLYADGGPAKEDVSPLDLPVPEPTSRGLAREIPYFVHSETLETFKNILPVIPEIPTDVLAVAEECGVTKEELDAVIETHTEAVVPEPCGAWAKNKYAGRADGERGSVVWSAPYDGGRLMAVTICPRQDIDGVLALHHAFTRTTHPTGLNTELHALADLFGFDWEISLRIAQGLD